MGLIAEQNGSIEGYEAVPLPLVPDETSGSPGRNAAVLRRRSARPSKRAVLYVHCLGDSFVSADVADWYTERGFHFYVADLRTLREPGQPVDPGTLLAECFSCLDAAVRHLRRADAIGAVVVGAHAAGALIAALWSHARRGSRPVDALVLANPEFGPHAPWLSRAVAAREASAAARRASPLLAKSQRRLRRGLDIACPVLVMCPSEGWDDPGGPGGLLAVRTLFGGRATMRLGAHVTWMRLDGGLPGDACPGGAARRRFFDELGRWLSAYLSAQIRDQLL